MPTYWVVKLNRQKWYFPWNSFAGTHEKKTSTRQEITPRKAESGNKQDCRAKRTHCAAQHLSTSLPFLHTQLTFQHVPALREQQLRHVQTSIGPVLCCQSLFAAGAKLIQHKRSSMPMWEQELRCMPWNLSQVDLKLRLCLFEPSCMSKCLALNRAPQNLQNGLLLETEKFPGPDWT